MIHAYPWLLTTARTHIHGYATVTAAPAFKFCAKAFSHVRRCQRGLFLYTTREENRGWLDLLMGRWFWRNHIYRILRLWKGELRHRKSCEASKDRGHTFPLTSLPGKDRKGRYYYVSDREFWQGLPNAKLFLERMERTASSFHLRQKNYLQITRKSAETVSGVVTSGKIGTVSKCW